MTSNIFNSENLLERKSPLKNKITAEEIITLCKRSFSPAQIAVAFEMSLKAFQTKIKEDPALLETYEYGMTILRANYDKVLHHCALGIPLYYEDEEGNKKLMRACPPALMFLGKTKFGLRDSDPSVNVSNTFNNSEKEGAAPIKIVFSSEEKNV